MYNYDKSEMGDPQLAVAYKQAERRVQAKLGFYSHLTTYVLVNALLIGLYILTGPVSGSYSYPWFVWPMFGWGIGLLFHYAGVFVFSAPQATTYRTQMIETELQRMGIYTQPAHRYSGTNPTSEGNEGALPHSYRPPDKS